MNHLDRFADQIQVAVEQLVLDGFNRRERGPYQPKLDTKWPLEMQSTYMRVYREKYIDLTNRATWQENKGAAVSILIAGITSIAMCIIAALGTIYATGATLFLTIGAIVATGAIGCSSAILVYSWIMTGSQGYITQRQDLDNIVRGELGLEFAIDQQPPVQIQQPQEVPVQEDGNQG